MPRKIICFAFIIAMFSIAACGKASDVMKGSAEPTVKEAIDPTAAISPSLAKYEAEILEYELTTDIENNDVLLVTLKWTNNSEDTVPYWTTLMTKAFQDGIELSAGFLSYDHSAYEKYSDNIMLDVRPGASIEVTKCFVIRSTSDIEIEVSELISFDDSLITSDIYKFN